MILSVVVALPIRIRSVPPAEMLNDWLSIVVPVVAHPVPAVSTEQTTTLPAVLGSAITMRLSSPSVATTVTADEAVVTVTGSRPAYATVVVPSVTEPESGPVATRVCSAAGMFTTRLS